MSGALSVDGERTTGESVGLTYEDGMGTWHMGRKDALMLGAARCRPAVYHRTPAPLLDLKQQDKMSGHRMVSLRWEGGSSSRPVCACNFLCEAFSGEPPRQRTLEHASAPPPQDERLRHEAA